MSALFNRTSDGLFDADVTATMEQALDFLSSARPAIDKDVLTRKIVEIAKNGERDVVRLCTKVLQHVDSPNSEQVFPHGNS
jgi:hypothetical protein